jgi:hypothetical protein
MGWAWVVLAVAGLVGLCWIWLAWRLDRLEVLTFRGQAPRRSG